MVIKRTCGASGHRLVVIGVVWPEWMKCEWLQLECTTSLNHRVPAPSSVTKNPFTINTVIRQDSRFCCQSMNSKMFSAENSAQVSLCVRSQCLMHEGLLWHFIWLLLYAAFFLLLYQASTHTRDSTKWRICVLLDVNKNTSLKQRCESKRSAGLTGWLSF